MFLEIITIFRSQNMVKKPMGGGARTLHSHSKNYDVYTIHRAETQKQQYSLTFPYEGPYKVLNGHRRFSNRGKTGTENF